MGQHSQPSLQDNDFVLFGLPQQFAVDTAALTAQWKKLQQQMHPDRFAGQGAASQRIAMQWSGRINEAYQRLKNPLQRAAYLCALRGQAVDAENNTAMPPDFLMQQMEWREALDDAESSAALDALLSEVDALEQTLHTACAQALDGEQKDTQKIQEQELQETQKSAAEAVRKWMFVQKFRQDVRKQYARFRQ